jgi:acyl transferase domain-containing protein
VTVFGIAHFSRQDAAKVIAVRSTSQQQMAGSGGMLAVGMSAAELRKLIGGEVRVVASDRNTETVTACSQHHRFFEGKTKRHQM